MLWGEELWSPHATISRFDLSHHHLANQSIAPQVVTILGNWDYTIQTQTNNRTDLKQVRTLAV